MISLPVCEHLGYSTSPPEGESVAKSCFYCEAGKGKQGKVCKCNCSPAKCNSYQANSEYVSNFRWISTFNFNNNYNRILSNFPTTITIEAA